MEYAQNECPWCHGFVEDSFTDYAVEVEPGVFAACCSDVCQKIVAGTHWPAAGGPAGHGEILGWIEEQKKIDELAARRQAELAAKGR